MPSGTSGTNGAVPSSGQISFSQFYGTSAAVIPTVSLGNYDLVGLSDDISSITSTLYFVVNSSGMSVASYSSTSFSADVKINTVSQGASGDYNIESWLDTGAAGDVAIYVTQTSGSALVAGSSALTTYLNLGTTRQWGLQCTRSSIGSQTKACTLSVSFVQASNTSNVLDTATITIQNQVDFTT